MKMKSISLMTGVAVAALVFGAPGAFAQVAITQGTAVTPITNSAAVTGTAADSITTSGAISGLLSGASIGSTGVDAAVGVLLFRAMGGRFRSLLPSDLVSLVFFSSSLSLSCFFWEEEKLLQSKEGERKGKTDSLSRTRLTKNIFLFHPTFFSPPGETGRLRR